MKKTGKLGETEGQTDRQTDGQGNSVHLVVALDRWIVSKICSYSRCDDIVGSAHQAAHEGKEEEQDGDGDIVHVLREHPEKRAEDAWRG